MNYIIKQINEIVGFDIRVKYGKREVTSLRKVASKLMHEDGLTLEEIARELKSNGHDAIIYYLQTFYSVYNKHIDIYNKLKSKREGLSNTQLRKKYNKENNLYFSDDPTLIDDDKFNSNIELMKSKIENLQNINIKDTASDLTEIQDILYGMFAEHGLLNLHEGLYYQLHVAKMGGNEVDFSKVLNI